MTRILLVDNDTSFSTAVAHALAALDVHFHVEEDTERGIQHILQHRPDLIVLSAELPKQNGFLLCNRLKRDPVLKQIPVIVLWDAENENLFHHHQGLVTRADLYVAKPVTAEMLLQHVARFVSLQSMREGLPQEDDEMVLTASDFEQTFASSPASLLSQEEDRFTKTGVLTPEDIEMIPREEGVADQASEGDQASTLFTKTGVLGTEDIEVVPLESGISRQVAAGGEGMTASTLSFSTNSIPSAARSAQRNPQESEAWRQEREAMGLLRQQLAEIQAYTVQVERQRDAAQQQIDTLRRDALEAAEARMECVRLQREVTELRQKIATAGSSEARVPWDPLTLREAMHRKDKELVALKEALMQRDKDVIQADEQALLFERRVAELNEQALLATKESAALDAKHKQELETLERTLTDRFLARQVELEEDKRRAVAVLEAERAQLRSEVDLLSGKAALLTRREERMQIRERAQGVALDTLHRAATALLTHIEQTRQAHKDVAEV